MKTVTSKEKVLDYINKQNTFIWVSDIADYTLWGFKNAPFKSWKRAVNFVQKVLDELEQDGKLIKEEYENRKPVYYKVK